MSQITWTDVTDEAAELANGVSFNTQTVLLDYVNTKIRTDGLDGEAGRKTFLARVYLAAHMATLLKRRGIAGTVTSQSAGPVSESLSLLTLPWLGVYSTTSYGVLYAMIVQSSAHRAGALLNRRSFATGVGRGDRGSGGWGG